MTETFGQYKLVKRLASGGMAEVYLAMVHGVAGFTKPVVIKRLHPRLSEDQDFIQMLIDEARITSQLTHSNICQVLDLGAVDKSYFIAMEHIAGDDLSTLQEYCRRQKVQLPIEAIIYIISEVLSGLDYAHRKEGSDGQPLGIIHRDISPQNIIITYEGEVKVIDFGIAKARLRLVHTQAGVIKGKFRYMSPEQAMGGMIDHRTDVFATGVVFYELLRGKPHSLDLSNTEVLDRIRKAEFEPLRNSRPDIPPELDNIVKKALKRKIEHRFSGASEFRNVLLNFLQRSNLVFGRSELARIMRQVFDEDRRRERSGSFSGPVDISLTPGPMTPIPVLASSVKCNSTSVLDEEEQTPAYVVSGERPSPPAVAPKARLAQDSTPTHQEDGADQSGQRTTHQPVRSSTGAPMEARTIEFEATLSVDEQAITNQRAQQGPSYPPLADMAQTKAFSRGDTADDGADLAALEILGVGPVTDMREQETKQRTLPAVRARAPRLQHTGARTRSVLYGPSIIAQPAVQEVSGSYQKPANSSVFFTKQTPPGEVTPIQEGTEKNSVPQARPLISTGALVVVLLFICGVAVLGLYLYNGSLSLFAPTVRDRGVLDSAPAMATHSADAGAALTESSRSRVALKVQSVPPGARIQFCGRTLSKTTPATLRVRAGKTCSLTLSLLGYVTHREEVTPRRGSPTIQATLKKRSGLHDKELGTLRVTSIQVGTVYVDGQPRGSTPLLILSLPARSYSIAVHFQALNLQTAPRRVTVSAGETNAVHFDPMP